MRELDLGFYYLCWDCAREKGKLIPVAKNCGHVNFGDSKWLRNHNDGIIYKCEGCGGFSDKPCRHLDYGNVKC